MPEPAPEPVPLMGFASFMDAAAFFGSTCGVTNCHDNRYPPSLSNRDLAVLRTTLETYEVARCNGLPLLVAGNPDGSALPMLLRGECDDLYMPFGCFDPLQPPCVPAADIEKVQLWIGNPDPFL